MLDPTRNERFPIGPFVPPAEYTHETREDALAQIADLPQQLREALRGLSDEQLNTPYRDGGWTLRQVAHHLADSHTTAFHRFRKALTEDFPLVTAYPEELFAELPDAHAPIEWSLQIVEGTHARWVMMLQDTPDAEFQRGYTHSASGRQTIEHALHLYAWHGMHHLAHITHLRSARGW
ncbi:YfiT family bacillithiol transferase [Granulicella cerasi]|uniref:YfiT family bacillithiol transferase n=1 Tax=Granulicella cerasi TaxID=741063 RepID=A0ABW1Z7N1_9BACT|nr:putative metal-dependent hydrolase [Granulicella cerasi]